MVKATDSYNLVAFQTYILEVHYAVELNKLQFFVQSKQDPISIISINDGSNIFFVDYIKV